MAISNNDGWIGSAKQLKSLTKASMTSKAAGIWQSLWTCPGFPGAGVAPSSVAGIVPTNTTAGGLQQANPSNTLYASTLQNTGSIVGTLILYDRLLSTDGLSGTVSTTQNITSTALTRYTSGVDVEAWLEFYSPTGATGATFFITYANTVPTAGQTSVSQTFPPTTVAGQMFPIPLAAGDLGVTSIASLKLSGTTGTAGNFGITLMKRLATIPITQAAVGANLDPFGIGLPIVQTNACLAFAVLCSAATTGAIIASLGLVDG